MQERRFQKKESSLPEKANRILNGILVVLTLIALRLWHLSVVQHEEKVEASLKPQKRVVIERAERATICDRFHIPLAINKIQYNATVCYGQIREEIPRCVWVRTPEGKTNKIYKRTEYIKELSQVLAKELKLDPERIEDSIHGKASIFGNAPFLIKQNISESEYFRLKMLEKDWPGVYADITSRRTYPLNKVGGEVVGYMGAISHSEYDAITQEMRQLRQILSEQEDEEALLRLKELEARAYTINDAIGKAGGEAAFEEELRGKRGKKIYLSDIRGNYMQELPGSEEPTSGKRLVLTISSELQEYAEKLLAQFDQKSQSKKLQQYKKQSLVPENQPWIKGGAIVVMDPNNGEILALASYPRFDPNDFIPGVNNEGRVSQWLENESYIASLWDRKNALTRERFDPQIGEFYEEALEIDWSAYLSFILPKRSPVRETLENFGSLRMAISLQKKMESLFSYFLDEGESPVAPKTLKIVDFVFQAEEDIPLGITITLQERDSFQRCALKASGEIQTLKSELSPYFRLLALNYEKVLLCDVCRLLVEGSGFPNNLSDLLGEQSLSEFREASARLVSVKEAVRKLAKSLFHETEFKKWKEKEFKRFLKMKRKEETAKKRYARPYLDYLDEAFDSLFSHFWEEKGMALTAFFLTGDLRVLKKGEIPEIATFLQHLLMWKREIQGGAHSSLKWVAHYLRLQEMMQAYDPAIVVDYLAALRSFDSLTRPLWGRYTGLRSDRGEQLEKHLAAAFYPTYGYGNARSTAFRQATTIGSIFKLVPAYEAVRQRYCKQEGQGNLNPFTMIDDKQRTNSTKGGGWNVGFTQDGKPIPLFYHGGRLPRSDHAGVGKVDLVKAIEASSNPYFALLSGEILDDPEDLIKAARQFSYGSKTGIDLPGEFAGRLPSDVTYNRSGLYALSIGQHSLVGTPLQTAVMLASLANGGAILKPKIALDASKEVREKIFLPASIRGLLLEGMQNVVMGEKGTARYLQNLTLFKQFSEEEFIGKTSTAESVERISLDGTSGRLMCKHVWFGALSFHSNSAKRFANPELVVVVYLRMGDYGNEAAPLALKMVKKWRELQDKYSS